MKKSLYSLFAVLAIFCACQDENSQLGKSLVESSFYNVYADTCSVDISTILLDSIETRGDCICSWDITGAAPGEKYPPPTMPNTPRPTSPPTQTIPIPSTPSYCE